MRLLFVRHGESAGNVLGVIQGRADYPLTPRGVEQARALAAKLAADSASGDLAPVAALYTSPLARAAATAAEIGRALAVAPTPDPDLQECDCGDATGLTWDEFADRHPAWAAKVATNVGGQIVDEVWPRGETTPAFRARCRRAVERIAGRHGGEPATVIIVSHGGAISWMLAHLLTPGVNTWPAWTLPNASVSEVRIAGGQATVVRIGSDTRQLETDSVSETESVWSRTRRR
jgi:broad specificity phosphatase PhoE